MASIPGDFFTPESMLTLVGATSITTIVTNSCRYAFNWNPKWFGLAIALVISLTGVILTDKPAPLNFFMGLINGFLIYASATGIMALSGNRPVKTTKTKSTGASVRRFWEKWY
jgi:hypothetical protein